MGTNFLNSNVAFACNKRFSCGVRIRQGYNTRDILEAAVVVNTNLNRNMMNSAGFIIRWAKNSGHIGQYLCRIHSLGFVSHWWQNRSQRYVGTGVGGKSRLLYRSLGSTEVALISVTNSRMVSWATVFDFFISVTVGKKGVNHLHLFLSFASDHSIASKYLLFNQNNLKQTNKKTLGYFWRRHNLERICHS